MASPRPLLVLLLLAIVLAPHVHAAAAAAEEDGEDSRASWKKFKQAMIDNAATRDEGLVIPPGVDEVEMRVGTTPDGRPAIMKLKVTRQVNPDKAGEYEVLGATGPDGKAMSVEPAEGAQVDKADNAAQGRQVDLSMLVMLAYDKLMLDEADRLSEAHISKIVSKYRAHRMNEFRSSPDAKDPKKKALFQRELAAECTRLFLDLGDSVKAEIEWRDEKRRISEERTEKMRSLYHSKLLSGVLMPHQRGGLRRWFRARQHRVVTSRPHMPHMRPNLRWNVALDGMVFKKDEKPFKMPLGRTLPPRNKFGVQVTAVVERWKQRQQRKKAAQDRSPKPKPTSKSSTIQSTKDYTLLRELAKKKQERTRPADKPRPA